MGVYLGEIDGKRGGALHPKPATLRRNDLWFVSFFLFENVEGNRMSVPGYFVSGFLPRL